MEHQTGTPNGFGHQLEQRVLRRLEALHRWMEVLEVRPEMVSLLEESVEALREVLMTVHSPEVESFFDHEVASVPSPPRNATARSMHRPHAWSDDGNRAAFYGLSGAVEIPIEIDPDPEAGLSLEPDPRRVTSLWRSSLPQLVADEGDAAFGQDSDTRPCGDRDSADAGPPSQRTSRHRIQLDPRAKLGQVVEVAPVERAPGMVVPGMVVPGMAPPLDDSRVEVEPIESIAALSGSYLIPFAEISEGYQSPPRSGSYRLKTDESDFSQQVDALLLGAMGG